MPNIFQCCFSPRKKFTQPQVESKQTNKSSSCRRFCNLFKRTENRNQPRSTSIKVNQNFEIEVDQNFEKCQEVYFRNLYRPKYSFFQDQKKSMQQKQSTCSKPIPVSTPMPPTNRYVGESPNNYLVTETQIHNESQKTSSKSVQEKKQNAFNKNAASIQSHSKEPNQYQGCYSSSLKVCPNNEIPDHYVIFRRINDLIHKIQNPFVPLNHLSKSLLKIKSMLQKYDIVLFRNRKYHYTATNHTAANRTGFICISSYDQLNQPFALQVEIITANLNIDAWYTLSPDETPMSQAENILLHLTQKIKLTEEEKLKSVSSKTAPTSPIKSDELVESQPFRESIEDIKDFDEIELFLEKLLIDLDAADCAGSQ